MRNVLDLEPSTLISGQNVLELPGKVCCFLSSLQRSLLASLMHMSSISLVSGPVSCTAASTMFVLTFGYQRGTLPFIMGLPVWGVLLSAQVNYQLLHLFLCEASFPNLYLIFVAILEDISKDLQITQSLSRSYPNQPC